MATMCFLWTHRPLLVAWTFALGIAVLSLILLRFNVSILFVIPIALAAKGRGQRDLIVLAVVIMMLCAAIDFIETFGFHSSSGRYQIVVESMTFAAVGIVTVAFSILIHFSKLLEHGFSDCFAIQLPESDSESHIRFAKARAILASRIVSLFVFFTLAGWLFFIDHFTPKQLITHLLYCVPLSLMAWLEWRRATWALTLILIVVLFVGQSVGNGTGSNFSMDADRLVSAAAIVITASILDIYLCVERDMAFEMENSNLTNPTN